MSGLLMLVLQSVPEVPQIPFDPNGPALAVMALAFFAMLAIILWPIARALARRLEGSKAGEPGLRQELEQLRHRLAEVDALQHQVAELEERLDFAERLLARAETTAAQLPRGEQ